MCVAKIRQRLFIIVGISLTLLLLFIMMSRSSPFQNAHSRASVDGHISIDKWKEKLVPYCSDLISGHKFAYEKARHLMNESPKNIFAPKDYLNYLTSHTCDEFIKKRNYAKPVNDDESTFPIAYGMLVYKDIEQVERLLRMIYVPQNFYCIHIDKKSGIDFRNAMRKIISCFPNVFEPEEEYDVYWAHNSILQAELSCMKSLLKKKWKYFINLTGQDVPLKTNRELVDILKLLGGANNVQNIQQNRDFYKKRWMYKWKLKSPYPVNNVLGGIVTDWKLMLPVPHDITVLKGSNFVTLSREFVEFLFNNTKARAYIKWLKDAKTSDELLFATMNENAQLCPPGGYAGPNSEDDFITRFVIWSDHNKPCHGKYTRSVCIFGVGDLSNLLKNKRLELFANKMEYDFQHLAFDCLEEYHRNRTIFTSSSYYVTPELRYEKFNFKKKKLKCKRNKN